MLSIVLTTHKLLAGVHEQNAKILPIQTHNFIPFHDVALETVLEQHLPEIQGAYQKWHHGPIDSPIPTTIALPVDVKEGTIQNISQLIQKAEAPSMRLLHTNNLAGAYASGLNLTSPNLVVLECLEDYLNLCYLLEDQEFQSVSFPEIGPRQGNEAVLAAIGKRFEDIGLILDEASKNDLLRQLKLPMQEYVFSVSKAQGQASYEAEAVLQKEEFQQLLTARKDILASPLNAQALSDKKVQNIILLGQYLHNEVLNRYFKEDLQLGELLKDTGRKGPWTEYETIIAGLYQQGNVILEEEERKRKEEAERKRREAAIRAKINAELEAKQKRENLLAEIHNNCIDPEKVAEYEEKYVTRGQELGIPEMIIKWNISEVIGKISLKQTQEKLGTGEIDDVALPSAWETDPAIAPEGETIEAQEREAAEAGKEIAPPEAVAPKAPGKTSKTQPEAEQGSEVEAVKPAEQPEAPEAEEKTQPEEKEKAAPVLATNGTDNKGSDPAPSKTAENPLNPRKKEIPLSGPNIPAGTGTITVAVPTASKTTQVKTKGKKDVFQAEPQSQPGLSDLFAIKGSLPDPEFSTKRVLMKGDPSPKVVRVLNRKEGQDPQKEAAFRRLYKKELAYYENVSQLSAAKEGVFYYREYLERNTLKQYVKKLGLSNKSAVEDLNSQDLKFILQIFKEVKDLPVFHANITEENILVISKRKWNLQKNVSIHFVGFTSEDCSKDQMIQQTHKMFARLFGEKFYVDFRKKFQL
jgi:hypothetical protein